MNTHTSKEPKDNTLTPEQQETLHTIRHHMEQGAFNEALTLSQTLHTEAPHNRDVQYTLAANLRYTENYLEALQQVEELITQDADYGRAFQEKGHILTALNKHQEALTAYQNAVRLNPTLSASWRGIALELKKQGDESEAINALNQFKYLSQIPPELVSAASLMHEGKLYKAENLCRHYLQKHPHHPEAMRILALIGFELGILDDADFLLESCLELHPGFEQARYDYIKVLRKRQKFEKALSEAKHLVEKHPNNRPAEIAYATQSSAVGDYDTALAIYDKQLQDDPSLFELHLQRGHIFKTIGKSDEANHAYKAASTLKPDYGDAYWSLANMKTYRFSDEEIEEMKRQERSNTIRSIDQFHLCFALGKALEDKHAFEESFHYYEKGNALKQQQTRYTIEQNTQDTDLQIRFCTQATFAENNSDAPKGHPAPDPIFIVGLPRAGSTLLEQILASHSQVDGTLELSNILSMARKLNGHAHLNQHTHEDTSTPNYPKNLADLSEQQLYDLGQQFLNDTQIHRKGAPFFIDKMPNNFRHIGLIHKILPNAKIIDARRHPMACCFSGFKQLFAEGQEFTYGLERIGEYYKDYVRLMEHWDKVLPNKILRVHYEHVVDDLETQVKRILDYCGLPFEEQCLNFHKTKRAVRTASAEQVRQPIYKSGVEQWKNYADFLAPLENQLKDIIKNYPA